MLTRDRSLQSLERTPNGRSKDMRCSRSVGQHDCFVFSTSETLACQRLVNWSHPDLAILGCVAIRWTLAQTAL